ncbi:MAG: efflux RND transporter periplasmic adaptor subunit [Alphaproteobacteria bacterium]|nr:efflux RND transporter periplasmic adaptor subunit [Alphaproteobacteria bacterium]
MKASRITAVGLVVAAVLWILSGYIIPHETAESRAALRATETEQKPFRVATIDTDVTPHSRTLLLSGRTEADRKVTVYARTGGILTELRVRRGSRVEKGEVLAVLSDEAREAQVAQAQALADQRKTELEAKRRLLQTNAVPRLEVTNLEAQVKAAEAALATAVAERDRGVVTAPWAGLVTDVPAEIGTSAFSMAGKEIAQVVALDPMLAVVEVSERRVGGIKTGDSSKVRLVTGQTVEGRIRFVSKTASQTTRTYRVEVEIRNPDGEIPDGITAEIAIPLAPVPATRVPRSALTIAADGRLGVRLVGVDSKVEFAPISVVEDQQGHMWVGGVPAGARVIVQGQDFVREGLVVEAVPAAAAQAASR